jgi:hypothetical protein
MSNEIVKSSKSIDETIATFAKIKEIAEYVATSGIFTAGYEIKDKEGKVVIDESTGLPKVNIADVAMSIVTGYELGLDLGGSLLLGKKLNPATYLSVIKGKEIGVGIATALEKIVSIPTRNGLISYTMVDVISAKLIEGGVSFLPFLRNFAPFYRYYDASSKEELDLDVVLNENDFLKEDYFLVNAGTTPELLKEALTAGKKTVTRIRYGEFTKAKFVRKTSAGIVTHYQRFSTLDAQRAGLLPVYDKDGKELAKGKDNWISNTPQMMANRVISIGGRIIGADLIHGLYTKEELIDAKVITEQPATVDAQATVI